MRLQYHRSWLGVLLAGIIAIAAAGSGEGPLGGAGIFAGIVVAAIPGLRLEKLKGGRAGQHSIRINDQFRICFHWTYAGAEDVEIVDYH